MTNQLQPQQHLGLWHQCHSVLRTEWKSNKQGSQTTVSMLSGMGQPPAQPHFGIGATCKHKADMSIQGALHSTCSSGQVCLLDCSRKEWWAECLHLHDARQGRLQHRPKHGLVQEAPAVGKGPARDEPACAWPTGQEASERRSTGTSCSDT
jgi:hypothetical protein